MVNQSENQLGVGDKSVCLQLRIILLRNKFCILFIEILNIPVHKSSFVRKTGVHKSGDALYILYISIEVQYIYYILYISIKVQYIEAKV